MDAKDLRTEAALGARSNDGNSKYTQASVLQANRNKTYHDVGSNTLAKEGQGARPCAVIGPDRVVPPPAPADAYLKKASVDPWPTHETAYRKPPEYPHKLICEYNHPSRNISPRQTFQENMLRFNLPPSYNSTKLNEDHNFPVDANSSPLRNKLSGSAEGKYCEVPYVVSPLASEQKNVRSVDVSVSTNNPTLPKSAPHGWPPSSANIRPGKPYGAPEVYQYPEYQNCSGPRPVLVPRPHRTVHEDPGLMYPESYYHDANLRYKPYPTIKERNPQARYDYVGNYSNPFHPPPPPFPSHKYEMQKQLPPHPYAGYPQVPLKYMDPRVADPTINGFQRPINPNTNFNSVAYRNQIIHPQYGPVPGNCLQPNKFYPYPPDKSISANKPPYDATAHKAFGEYENMRGKPYHMSDAYYVNEMMRGRPIKAAQVMPPSYPTVGMPGMPPHHYYYRKDNPTMMNYENNPHYRNIDPSINLNAAMLSRLPTQFSPNAIAISPSESNTSNDITNSLGISQEDCGYVSQSSLGSLRSVDSGLHRMQGDFYKRYDYRYGPMVKYPPTSKSNISSNTNLESKNKKNINLKQYLEMWNEGEDEYGESTNKEMTVSSGSNQRDITNHNVNSNHEPLYVLGLVNVPSEELSKYEHIQKVSKLPENIKGYNSIELLNQFEEVIESSNLNNYSGKPSTPRNFQMSSLQSSTMESIGIPSRPLSPLDVESKISQSVIHKEVGCNFEIKPCSPKMLNVEVATPIKNVLSERVIEKVNNPVSSPTASLTKIDDNVRDCEIIKHHNHRISLNDNKTSSCKMTSSQYTSSEHSNSVKSNYSLQDLESNSGVCLASLPRLDNDIELTFPEVNQQFINANKVESVITTTQKDLPSLDVDQPEVMHEMEIKRSLPQAEPEKEFSKLSKYRKRRRNSGCKEDMEINVQSIRTNSVIMKNPENTKILERCADNFFTINMQDAQRDPINLSVYSEVRGNTHTPDYIEKTRNTCQKLKPTPYSENSSIEINIDNKGSFIDENQYQRRDERCNEEIICTSSVVIPNNPKSKNDISCILETSDIKENKLECNIEIPEDIAPVAKLKKNNHMNSEENMLQVDQIILKEASEHQNSILTDDIKEVERTNYIQLSEYINTKPNTSAEEEPADEVLSVNNTILPDDKRFKGTQERSRLLERDSSNLSNKLSQECEYLSKPDVSSNVSNSEIQSDTEELCDTAPHKSFESNLEIQKSESTSTTKLQKELYSPRIQNLIVYTEGNPKNPLLQEESNNRPESAEIDISMQTSLEECDVGNLEKQIIVDSTMAEEYSEKRIEVKSEDKQKTVSCDVMVNIDISAQKTDDDLQPSPSDYLTDTLKNNNDWDTNEHTKEVQQNICTDLADSNKSDSFFIDDSSESVSSNSSTTDSDSDDLSDVTSFDDENERDLLSPSTLKDVSTDLTVTGIQSLEQQESNRIQSENFKENIKTILETNITFSGILDSSNGKHAILDVELSKTTNCYSSVDRGLEFKISSRTDIESKDNCKVKINLSDEDKFDEKDSLIEGDDCGSVDHSEIKDTQKCEKDNLSDTESTLIQADDCDSMDCSKSKDTLECKMDNLSDKESTLIQSNDCDSMDRSKSIDTLECKKDILSDKESTLIQADDCDSMDRPKSKDTLECKQDILSNKESTLIQADDCDSMDRSKGKDTLDCKKDILSKKESTLFQADACDSMDLSKSKDTLECKNDILSDKESTLIQADVCDSMDHSKSKDTLECKKDILSDTDSTFIQADDDCDSLDHSISKYSQECKKDIPSGKEFKLIQADDCDSINLSKRKDTQECKQNILSDNDSTLLQSDDCNSIDHSKRKHTQEWNEKITDDNKDVLQMPCEYSMSCDKVDDTKLRTHFAEKPDFLVDCAKEANIILKEKESRDFTHNKIDTEHSQEPIEETKNKKFIDSQYNDDTQVVNVHNSSNKLTNLEDICNDSENCLVPEEDESSNKSFHQDNVLGADINQSSTSLEETVEMIRNFNDLAAKMNLFNTDYSHSRPKPLKRSLSDSAINACNISQEDQDNGILLNKRMKTTEPVTLQSQYITENYCNIIQNNRRNSISSVYNEENVSFCILIDNSCILTEECEENDKFCYTEIPEHCLSCIESDGDNEIIEESTELISIQDEINYDHCENISLHKDSDDVGEKESQEPWVDDIACVETVVSEEVAEDIVVSDSTPPRDKDMSDDDNGIFNMNEHTDKVKYIYGEGMCTDDAYIVETLYRTPQMNVNKTLVCRESQDIDDCHRYYDNESLEKLLSESPSIQNEMGCPLSATFPRPNTDTGSIEKSDLDQGSQNNSRLTEVECIIEQNSAKTQDDTVHSCETSVDDVFSYDHVKESPKRTSSSPEVSSTTSEERNSSIRLKITTFGGSRVAQVNSFDGNKSITSVSCKYTEKKDYAESHNKLLPNRPLITKAAQKYIPPIKETIRDLKVKLPLPQHSLLKLKELKLSKEEPKVTNNKINKHNNTSNCIRKEITKKTKPKFEDVLKSIDELQFKMHKEKSKKNIKKLIPKVVIKKNENGSHYTSTSNKERYNPDLTGRKWQPWVFIEKNNFIDKMALKKKTKAIFNHRKNTFILAETFKKYKSCNAKFIISQPVFRESSKGHLKYTIRLKHNY